MNHTNSHQTGDPNARNANDAAALSAKIAAKKAQKEAAAAAADAAPGKPVPRKKAPTAKKDSVDDLLSAGLTAGKKKTRA